MSLIEFLVQDFSRFYPAAILMFSLATGDIYLFAALLLSEQFNYILKYVILKPAMGDKKYPVIGKGTRPPGAVDCGLYRTGSKKKKCPSTSYGMPSGHSQSALLFSTYKILELIKNKSTNPFFYATYVLLAGFIPWSRVNAKVHTVQQTIIGGMIGGGLGYLLFAIKSNILKLIFK